jgi:hypothetical protein
VKFLKNLFTKAKPEQALAPIPPDLPAYKRMIEPTPKFFGAMMISIFESPPLGLTPEELEEAVSVLPISLRPQGRVWVTIHLAHLFYLCTGHRYGQEFADEAVAFLLELESTKAIGQALTY